MKKVLWICSRLPAPLLSGDALYSAGLLKALAMTNDAAITLIGTRRPNHGQDAHLAALPNTTSIMLPSAQASGLRSLASSLPRDAYNLATPELALQIEKLLQQEWDWIAIDHAYSAGLLSTILKNRGRASVWYIAHNAEGAIRPAIARSFSNPLRRTIMQLDAEKYRRLEHRLVRAADAITCITGDDASYFRQSSPRVCIVPPIYLGKVVAERRIERKCPRSLLLLGSFEWVAKQKNLELIVDTLLPRFQQKGITLDVVGFVPQAVRDRYGRYTEHLRFHGRVDNLATIMAGSRGGLVPDLLGGGFKLKVLDYAFQRLPIFALRQAVAGTSPNEQSAMFLADDLDSLVETIVNNIDDLVALNGHQQSAFELISARFGLDAGISELKEFILGSRRVESRAHTMHQV